LFGRYGEFVFNRLITTCRGVFIRYIDIHDDKIPDLIDGAIPPELEQLDRKSSQFATLFNRIRDWRKNWFRAYTKAAELIMLDLKMKHNWTGMATAQLKVLYNSKFSYEYVYQLMTGVHAGTVNWSETLKHQWINNLWRTLFTFTMV